MRKLTAVLALILLMMSAFAAWFYMGGTLRGHVAIQTAPAADYPEAFGAIRALLSEGSAPQVFADTLPGDRDTEVLTENALLYLTFDGVRKFEAVGGKYLDPVIRCRIVAGGDHYSAYSSH